MQQICKKSGIYQIINRVNDKCCVGSAINISVRWRIHKRELRINKNSSCKLQHAWNKYGQECFEFKVLELCDNSDLLIKEEYWITKLNSIKNGYNTRVSAKSNLGLKFGPMTDEAKRKISNFNKGKKITEEHKNKLRELYKDGGPFYGKKHSNETRQKMSESRKGEKHPLFGKERSTETKQKMSSSLKGKVPWNKGIKGSIPWNKGKRYTLCDEAKMNMSKARKGEKHPFFGKKLSNETKNKISNSHKGKKLSEDHKNKIGESQKGRLHSEESKKKMREARKLYWERKKESDRADNT